MATGDAVRRFAERALRIERIIDQLDVNGRAVRALFILAAAGRTKGVTQSGLVEQMDLPKDVVSKLVTSMTRARLLKYMPAVHNRQMKMLTATQAGEKILAEIKAALQSIQ